jgi:hypothetical protein
MSATAQELAYQRELHIDGVAEDLVGVNWISVFTDGTMAIAQGDDHQLVFFARDGRRMENFGRAGAGPGEIGELLAYHGRRGDTLFIFDGGNNRITMVDRHAKLAGIFRLPPALRDPNRQAPPGITNSYPLAVNPNGNVLLLILIPPEFDPTPGWEVIGTHRLAAAWVTPDGQLVRVVAGWPRAQDVCGMTSSRQIECPRPMRVAGPDGRSFVVVTTIPTGPDAGRISISAYGPDGRHRYAVSELFPRVRIPSRVIDSIRALGMAPGLPARRIQYWRDAEFWEYYRPVQRVIVGEDDRVWIKTPTTGGKTPYRVFAADGRFVGIVTVPANVDIEAADGTHFWATVRDDDGIESIARYRLAT